MMDEGSVKVLAAFAESLETMKPLEFLDWALGELEPEMNDLTKNEIDHVERFCQEIQNIFNIYDQRDVSKTILTCALYNMTVHLLKEVMIERKAMTLGLQKPLFKQEMTFLFKGKRK
jgi:phosphoglucomutase